MSEPVIGPILDKWFEDTREEREPDGKIHPSSMSGCWRQAIYEANGVAPSDKKDVRNYRIMWFGTAIHELVQEALERTLSAVDIEVGVEVPLFPFAGSADAVVFVEKNNEEWHELLEFKTINVNQLRKKGFGPKPEHVEQARMYAWALNLSGWAVESIRICYFARDDMAYREFVIDPPSPEWIAEFEDKLRVSERLYLGDDKTLLPPRLPAGSWLCNYCVYRTRCWDQDDDNRRLD